MVTSSSDPLTLEPPTQNPEQPASPADSATTQPMDMQERMQLLGSIMQLMLHSPLHRQYTVNEIERRFIPSLIYNQFRYYAIDGAPIGFVNWAWIDDTLEPKYQTGQYELNLEEWTGGSNLWFPEMIAPFGHTRHIAKDLRTNIFPGEKLGKSLRLSPEGKFRTGMYRR